MNQGTCKLNAVMCDHILTHTHTHTTDLATNWRPHKRKRKTGEAKEKEKALAQKDFQFVKILSSGGQAIGNVFSPYVLMAALRGI